MVLVGKRFSMLSVYEAGKSSSQIEVENVNLL